MKTTRALGLLVAIAGCGPDVEVDEAVPDVGVIISEATAALTFTPVADARVEADHPTTNFGSSSELHADGSPVKESLLRFEVTSLPGAVSRATLRLYVTDSSSDGPAVTLTSSVWTEAGVTWNTRPAPIGSVLADIGAVASGTTVEYDVTAAVTTAGTYDFRLASGSTNGTDFDSREASHDPQLVIETVPGPCVPTTCEAEGADCGTLSDECGGSLSCGACTEPQTCGGGGTPNVCGGDTTIPDPIFVGVGDIASCSSSGDSITASLLDSLFASDPPGLVFTLGDNVYESGTASQFDSCYHPTWGRHKARTRPTPGNHDYLTSGASAYFDYFGAAAGDPDEGYYSYDLGAWHIIAINSNCSAVGGCGVGSPQEAWLRADLAANPRTCVLAYWHHPRFSSGNHGNHTSMQPIWQALYDARADVVLSGHDHSYERYAPQTPTGAADAINGIVQIVVGTGGRNHYSIGTPDDNSVVRSSGTFGVLKMTLHPTSYDWQFVPEPGKTFSDSGSADCH